MSPMPADSIKNLVGRWFGSFQLTRMLGSGSVGSVFLARDHSLRRDVALKVVQKGEETADEEHYSHFLREARAAARLVHPHVVQIYQTGEDEHYRFIAMEYVDGPTIRGAAKQEGGRLPELICLQRMREAADALKLAASMGICHRDIKPANLLLTSSNTLKITDFGLAAHVDAAHTIGLANPSAFGGTPNYMSPEQWQQLPLTPKSDIYSLGCTFYHIFTGQTPYPGGNLMVCLQAHVLEPVADPRRVAAEIGADFADLLMQCMAKSAEERPSAAELWEILSEMLHERRSIELALSPASGRPPSSSKVSGLLDASRASLTGEPRSSRPSGIRSSAETARNADSYRSEVSVASQSKPIDSGSIDYRNHFGLMGYPFSDIRKPQWFWNEEPYQSALMRLRAQVSGKTLKLNSLLGAAGSGRTFLYEMLKQRIPGLSIFPVEPKLLLGMRPLVSLCRQYGCFDVNPRASQQTLLDTFMSTALPANQPDAFFVIAVDGVDAGDRELLGELDEILSCASEKRMAMILIGMDNLLDEFAAVRAPRHLLNGHVPIFMKAMTLKQMNDYVDFRMRVVGSSGGVLGLDAASQQLLHARSSGLPRLINAHCHNALMISALRNEKCVSFSSVRLGLKSKSFLSVDAARSILQSG